MNFHDSRYYFSILNKIFYNRLPSFCNFNLWKQNDIQQNDPNNKHTAATTTKATNLQTPSNTVGRYRYLIFLVNI